MAVGALQRFVYYDAVKLDGYRLSIGHVACQERKVEAAMLFSRNEGQHMIWLNLFGYPEPDS
jgi:hypothetical protein